jgi:hypothetical protein
MNLLALDIAVAGRRRLNVAAAPNLAERTERVDLTSTCRPPPW